MKTLTFKIVVDGTHDFGRITVEAETLIEAKQVAFKKLGYKRREWHRIDFQVVEA